MISDKNTELNLFKNIQESLNSADNGNIKQKSSQIRSLSVAVFQESLRDDKINVLGMENICPVKNYATEVNKLLTSCELADTTKWNNNVDILFDLPSERLCTGVYEDCSFEEVNNYDLQKFTVSHKIRQITEDKKIDQDMLTRNVLETNKNTLQNPNTKANSFTTAREELNVQNLKKYGQRSEPQKESLFDYVASKKSLGTRRAVQNKFILPVDIDRTSSGQCSRSEKQEIPTTDNPIDEKLKFIDPKMVELISSEIMSKLKPVDWNDIAGLEYAKSIIQEAVVWPILRPDIFTGLRRPPRAILLFGPPGTGKTLIGKCIASQSKSTFFSISASSLTSKWVGDGEKMVRALFAVASVNQPSVVFIDEIDSLLIQRSETEHESSRRIKTEFLVQLDGAITCDEERILIVGATNRPQELDEAARRRFVRRLYIPLPNSEARLQILNNLLKQVPHSLGEDEMINVSKLTEGYSGADMEVLCREASMEPIRSIPSDEILFFNENDVRPVKAEDFQSALNRIRASVSQNDLQQYVNWNKVYGSGDVF